MDLGKIYHRSTFNDCYAINEDEIIINIKTGKDITKVNLIHGDPYIKSNSPKPYWTGETSEMVKSFELKHHDVYSITLKPEYKREQYYFEIFSQDEKVYLLENDFYTEEEFNTPGVMYQFFKFPWLNSSDIFKTPDWAKDTIWYQIMPDRFNRGSDIFKGEKVKEWKYEDSISYYDFYGGDLKGIREKLRYLKDLGISGIYLTPIMESPSSHKYNVTNYYKIDCDFGNEEEMITLVKEAHNLGIKVMVDAVFNHSSIEFLPWIDVLEKGEESQYFNWFFVNKFPIDKNLRNTEDSTYYSFSFSAGMPKLNTNNEEVAEYFINVLKYWVNTWNIDGIRFDVGDEVSHSFLKKIRYELKKVKPDIFLLGEVWQDSIEYLQGDEYDTVMNYPFVNSINDFFLFDKKTSKDLMYAINRCYSMYPKATNKVLFNLLDSHDIGRTFSRCRENLDVYFQQLTLLLTSEGSPSIYYGTEIAMTGDRDPLNRKCMPWDEIEKGSFDYIINDFKSLVSIRNNYKECKSSNINWIDTSNRIIHYEKSSPETREKIVVLMNAEKTDLKISNISNVLFSRKYDNDVLESGGIIIYKV